MKLPIEDLMAQSGVKFGTSGARGLATAMTDLVCHAYTKGFLQYLESIGEFQSRGGEVAVAGDFRPSTDRIMESVAQAVEALGARVVFCGKVPSPAVALLGLTRRIPAIMVTGSHIPDDRNGIKFNKCTGEVLKTDEAGITRQVVDIDATQFDAMGASRRLRGPVRHVDSAAETAYLARYLNVFPESALRGLRIGVYQHSAVGREVMVQVLTGLGAAVTPLGRSERFVPVDTEAIRDEDAALARRWAAEHRFDAIVSADGDSDRPLISDEHGEWIRGDVAGILCARFLAADSVSTPVSCNTAVERCGWFTEIRRTRIGSPYVVASMLAATAAGRQRVVGYEANGGFLTDSDLRIGDRVLRALPTRDAVIVLLGVLLLAGREGVKVSRLVASLPARFTASGLLKPCPTARSRAILERFSAGGEPQDRQALARVFGALCGEPQVLDRTDGLRVAFENGEILHLRPSGNAPEFRCYAEADAPERSRELVSGCLAILGQLAGGDAPGSDRLPPFGGSVG